jgi:peptide-methionine (S)-S-oxide reductase
VNFDSLQTVVLAGGCFWCTEAIFKRLKGVRSVTSGYANSVLENPSSERVTSGETNAAEAIRIQFDPQAISFEQLLDIFWATHDPTSLNRQGRDVGTQYRSAIFYMNESQRKIAEETKKKAERSGNMEGGIVTEISPFKNFYTAEQYHQNYYERNQDTNPYCSLVIAPKIKHLIDHFNSKIKKEYQGRV